MEKLRFIGILANPKIISTYYQVRQCKRYAIGTRRSIMKKWNLETINDLFMYYNKQGRFRIFFSQKIVS